MFGLRIVRHNKYVPIRSSDENHETLIVLMKRDIQLMNQWVQHEIKFFTENKNEKNEEKYLEVLQSLENTRLIIVNLYRLGNESHRIIVDFATRNQETDFTTIRGFYSRHRGMFITLLHQIYDIRIRAKKLSSQRKSIRQFLSTLDFMNTKFTFMIGLCRLLNRFEQDCSEYLGEGKTSIFPYNDTFDIGSIELDNHHFYEDIGKQYYPITRSFFTFYVAMVAGYYDTIKGVTKNEFLKNIVMTGLGAIYQLFPNAKVKKHNDFAKDQCFQEEGMCLWNAADSAYISPFFEMGLLPISVSKTFDVPVTKYLQIVAEEERFQNHVNEGPERTIHQKKLLWMESLKKSVKKEEEETEGEEEEEEEKEENENVKNEEIIRIEEENERNEENEQKGIEISDITHNIKEDEDMKKDDSDNVIDQNEEENEPREEEEEPEEQEKKIDMTEFISPPNSPTLKRDKLTGEISVDLFHFFFRRMMTFPLKEKTIQLRVIHNLDTKLPLEGILKCTKSHPIIFSIKETLFSISSIFSSQPKKRNFDGSIIFHCHGGGFIAMKSHTHEMYLRRWARQFELPIISVDYTNAPKERYPTQPLQCYLAYKFVVQNFKRLFGTDLKRIIIAGDSAGGNLTAVIISMSIADGFRRPDGAIINYPTFITSFEACPSRVLAYSDPLVSKPFLELVLGLYPPEKYPYKGLDPFLSPIVTPKAILERFPPVYMTACSLDPLFDDGICMAKKLDRYSNGRVFLTVYDAAPHGFLNFCDILAESRKEIDFERRWVHWLINDFYDPKKVEEEKKDDKKEQKEEESEERSEKEEKEEEEEAEVEDQDEEETG